MKTNIIEHEELNSLIQSIKGFGYKVIGPVVKDSAIVYEELASSSDLPIGWTDEQSNGNYHLKRRNDSAVFGWTVGPQSWKKFLFPPVQTMITAYKSSKGFNLSSSKGEVLKDSKQEKYAFFGIRSCELNAITIQDKIFLSGSYIDPVYESRRAGVFIVAVNCTQAGGTCFCASMKTGPKAVSGFDLALTEIMEENRHYFLVDVGTELGEEILKNVKSSKAAEEDIKRADLIKEKTVGQMMRSVNTSDLKNKLYRSSEHPIWERIAERCLTCANCTMVCPTCFCSNVEDVTDLSGKQVERVRKWDSCFTLDFSYIHGGSVRSSAKARYRQWLMHKFASWVDQFGVFGCVGCGRCITWCPVGIDITQELQAICENQV